jgi:hypothetical protein
MVVQFIARMKAVGYRTPVSTIERGQQMRQNRGVFAAGGCHSDPFPRVEQTVGDNCLVYFLFESGVKAVPAQLHAHTRHFRLRATW